jgi:hypothetical protein
LPKTPKYAGFMRIWRGLALPLVPLLSQRMHGLQVLMLLRHQPLFHLSCSLLLLLLPGPPIHSTSAAVVSSSRPQPVSSVTMTEPEVSSHASLRIRAQQDAHSLHARASKTPYTTIHHLHGQLDRPYHVCIDSEKRYVVVDSGHGKLQFLT